MTWLAVVVDSARNVTWATKLVFGVVSYVGLPCLPWVLLTSRLVVNAATGGRRLVSFFGR